MAPAHLKGDWTTGTHVTILFTSASTLAVTGYYPSLLLGGPPPLPQERPKVDPPPPHWRNPHLSALLHPGWPVGRAQGTPRPKPPVKRYAALWAARGRC